jgi:hypothetical protein
MLSHRYYRRVIPHLFPPILVARYLLALTAADQPTAQVPLLIVVSPASCCFVFASAFLPAYVH